MLTNIFSSIILALAVKNNFLNAEQAYSLSVIEESYAMEKWGEDIEQKAALQAKKFEAINTEIFLKFLR